MLKAAVIEDPAELGPLRESWDALALLTGTPFAAPCWAEAWWRHLGPAGAGLAVVAVHAGEELVGLAPLYAARRLGVTEARLLSGGLASRLDLLAKPGQEREVAEAIAPALAGAGARPDVIRWEAVDAASPWPAAISSAWPGDREHRIQEESVRSAPVVDLAAATYQEWLAGKSRNFRSQMGRRRRALSERGAVIRAADRSSLAPDLASFWRLHSGRWEGRGGSGAANEGAVEMLKEVGEGLIESGRFRLWMIDGPDGEAISAQVFIAAGGVVAYWNGGFDESWSAQSPGAVAILAAIEDAMERRDELLDLGGGEARYKERLADEDRPVAWRAFYPPGRRYPLARLRRLPEQTARRGSHLLRGRLGAARFNRLRRLLSRSSR